MRPKSIKIFMLSFVLGVFSGTAYSGGISVPLQATERLLIKNTNLSARDFWESYMSKDVEQRRLAEMYLIGVLDASEGNFWCSYSAALPGSIQELLYLDFKEKGFNSKKRASKFIVNSLSKRLPCKDKK